MVCHRDVVPYLLAIKSLYQGVGQGRVAIINDGTLTGEDLAILHHHVPGLMVFDIDAVDTGRCPRGGTWERLVKIMELSVSSYVIQMDADTLVSGPIPEVVQCWREGKSFLLLGGETDLAIAPAPATAQMVKGWIEKYNWEKLTVGALAESVLDSIPNAAERSYVHASSGFAGFAQGAFRLADLEEYSGWMQQRLGARWDEWGSEQIASNYILANAPGAVVLPCSRYACFQPPQDTDNQPFLHFIGTHRFRRGVYRRRAMSFLDKYKMSQG